MWGDKQLARQLVLSGVLFPNAHPEMRNWVRLEVERLAILFWREIRLAIAEAFETKANRDYQTSKDGNGLAMDRMFKDSKPSKLPKEYRALESMLSVEM